MMDNDPTYEPIIGGHKTFSMEHELRERGLHASANEVARQGDSYYEGPQGHPAPGSGSPRRDRVSASPARSSYMSGATPAAASMHSSPVHSPSHYSTSMRQGSPGYAAPPAAALPHYATHSAAPPLVTTTTTTYHTGATASPRASYTPAPGAGAGAGYGSPSPAYGSGSVGGRGSYTDNDPTYEPIIGGHKTFSMEHELRERGLHASANEVARQGDSYYEGPQGHPAPGSGSPRRDRVSASPARSSHLSGGVGGSLPAVSSSPYRGGSGSPRGTGYAAPPPATTTTTTVVYHSSPPPAYSAPQHASPMVRTNISPTRETYGSPAPLGGGGAYGSPPQHQVIVGAENDPSYEPIIGGHKTHSWEKELRERGLHAAANRVASEGDAFFEGPQGNPAPGSGSPRRDRVSPSPSRRGYSPV